MKIDSNKTSLNIGKTETQKLSKAEAEDATQIVTKSDSEKKENKNSKRTNEKITRWFAQVGVLESSGHTNTVDLIKQTSRREQIISLNKLKNLQNILDIAKDVNIESDNQEHVDPDWFFTFARLAEDIHSPAMQSLWGKIVAVEMSQPGSFSMRTLHLLTSMTQKDAAIFNRAASLASRKKNDSTPKLIVGYHQRPSFVGWLRNNTNKHINIAAYGLTYPDILALIDLGLIFGSEIESGELDPEQRQQWRCCDTTFEISPFKKGTALAYYKFTSIGAELYRLAAKQSVGGYVDILLTTLAKAFEIQHRKL